MKSKKKKLRLKVQYNYILFILLLSLLIYISYNINCINGLIFIYYIILYFMLRNAISILNRGD